MFFCSFFLSFSFPASTEHIINFPLWEERWRQSHMHRIGSEINGNYRWWWSKKNTHTHTIAHRIISVWADYKQLRAPGQSNIYTHKSIRTTTTEKDEKWLIARQTLALAKIIVAKLRMWSDLVLYYYVIVVDVVSVCELWFQCLVHRPWSLSIEREYFQNACLENWKIGK